MLYIMLPIKKIYVVSRHKTEDSISDSNLKFPLPFVLTMPHNATFLYQIFVFLIFGAQ